MNKYVIRKYYIEEREEVYEIEAPNTKQALHEIQYVDPTSSNVLAKTVAAAAVGWLCPDEAIKTKGGTNMPIKTTKSDWTEDLVELFVENFGTLFMTQEEYQVAFSKLNKRELHLLVLAVRDKLPYKSEKTPT